MGEFEPSFFIIHLTIFIPMVLIALVKGMREIYFWQVKEYRIDRYLSGANVFSAKGKYKYEIVILLVKLVLTVVFGILINLDNRLLYLGYFVYGVYLVDLAALIIGLVRQSISRPKLRSIRNIIIFTLSSFLIILFALIAIYMSYSALRVYTISDWCTTENPICIDLVKINITTVVIGYAISYGIVMEGVVKVVVSMMVIITAPIAWLKRARIKKQGQSTLALAKNIKTIGITGSYGKTTTKELLYQVLSKKYKVAKTPEHYNTAVGIAMAIKESVEPDTEIFIAEMGAYKIGEIKEATDIIPLDIAIVTGIEGQHLSLFGSMKNLVNTKFEIIQGLKDDKGVAILNGDNEYCIQMAGRTNHKKILYFSIDGKNKIASGTSEEEPTEAEESKMYKFPHDTNIYATKVQSKSNGISFRLSFSGTTYDVTTNVIGGHNVLNLLAVISTCVTLGMKVEEVVKIINETEFTFPYLNSKKALNDSILIDDGYNISHKGFIAGLDYLKLFKSDGRKWVMTQGLIELGVEKEMVYDNIAKEIVAVADGLMTNDKDLIEAIEKIKNEFKIIEILNVKEVDKLYGENVNIGDVVLLEGTFPDNVVKKILIDNR